ncbi:hypothetical protein [Alicyclobacillus mengziensis]|uniref:Uncharacterized protein n=1 Tax=Alicyclobacillus mengziensis TaxID=2931921 RepID=A0A9X7VXN2_9BACL|nr:hypothetical protein [Alicyclobacillus mengziensis]QSO46529.1 hypothetical protein JZ786_19000 [Alicyclobacillus mengziensis]
MRVGAVIGTDGETIVPLPDGPIIRVRDTESGDTKDLPNPAFGKETDRRPTAARALVTARVDIIATVPGSFCTPSHKIAVEGGIKFWQVEPATRWQELLQDLLQETDIPVESLITDRLPTSELMKQNWSSVKHYARLGIRRVWKR